MRPQSPCSGAPIALWKRAERTRKPGLNEFDLIKSEVRSNPWRGRADFQQMLHLKEH